MVSVPAFGCAIVKKNKTKNNADISRYLFLKRTIAKKVTAHFSMVPKILAPLHLNDGNVFHLKFILVN